MTPQNPSERLNDSFMNWTESLRMSYLQWAKNRNGLISKLLKIKETWNVCIMWLHEYVLSGKTILYSFVDKKIHFRLIYVSELNHSCDWIWAHEQQTFLKIKLKNVINSNSLCVYLHKWVFNIRSRYFGWIQRDYVVTYSIKWIIEPVLRNCSKEPISSNESDFITSHNGTYAFVHKNCIYYN